MVSDRNISQQKKQQGEGTTNAKEKERAKGDGGSRYKGSKSQNTETRKSYGLVTSVIYTPKISVHSSIADGDEVFNKLIE